MNDARTPGEPRPDAGLGSSPVGAPDGGPTLTELDSSPFAAVDGGAPTNRVPTVLESQTGEPAAPPRSGRPGLRWAVAGLGVVLVAAASIAVVSLAGGRPTQSLAIGYMPADAISYSEIRLDLPGDQRSKLAGFLQAFPGFADQSAIQPKLNDVFDRLMRAATQGQQTWTADIAPWFGGQVATAAGTPDPAAASRFGMNGGTGLIAVTITERAKAIAWVTTTAHGSGLDRTTYGDADLFATQNTDGGPSFAIAINDKVLLAGLATEVKAAIDGGGHGALAKNDDVAAALATIDRDYVALSVVRVRAYVESSLRTMAAAQPDILASSRIDDTVLALLPAWQATTMRFENDAIVTSSVGPSHPIGYDGANRASAVLGHVPAGTLVYAESHDVGPALSALIATFRALPETKDAFTQADQVLNLLGGLDTVIGWWGDAALVVTPGSNGMVAGGIVIQTRDAAATGRLFGALNSYAAVGAGQAGATLRTQDHNGTKITILDLSAVPGMASASLPDGYTPQIAWASTDQVAVFGSSPEFVASVLDAGPGHSLADDARFKALLARVGADDLGTTYVDIAGLRALVEPLMQKSASANEWAKYTTEIKPYLDHLDALIQNARKDGPNDRLTGAFTVR